MRWERRSTATWRRSDVRLTIGGEPTFVSVDDYEAAEWNIAALGPAKRERAEQLVRLLWRRFAPGAPAALRPGQMVPGRAGAALGAVALLAPRRRAGMA